jgi:HAMP domain-containing protein
MPLSALFLLLALARVTGSGDNPADLVDRVATGDPGARLEAAGRLEEIGRPALTVLRIARGKAEDPVAARRLGELIDLIARQRLLRATPVDRLEARDVTVAEAVADLGRRSGFSLDLEPMSDPTWTSKRVTLGPTGPLGFWEALDHLGASGGFRLEANSFRSGPAGDKPSDIRLARSEDPSPRTCYAGPFRVDLVSLSRHRQVTQPRPGAAPKPIDEFAAELRLVAEPGLEVERNGLPRVFEALAESGADLRPESTQDQSRTAFSARQWLPGPSVQIYRVPLAIPSGRGGTLKRLRGCLPIVVSAREGPIMIVPLAGAEGRTFSSGGIILTVRRVQPPALGRPGTLALSIRGEEYRSVPTIAAGPRELTLSPIRPVFSADDHIEILDPRGRPLPHYSSAPPPRPEGSIEVTITLQPNPQLGPPTTLRYHGVNAEATEVPFLFEDVPMP